MSTSTVLIVCTANQCRSALAELMWRAAQTVPESPWRVASAGTAAVDGAPIHADAAALLDQRSIDSSGFRSRRLTPPLIDDAELVLAATRSHRSAILELRPTAMHKTFVLDQFIRALPDDGVPRTTAGLVSAAAARRHGLPAAGYTDLADPTGRGPGPMHACLVTLDAAIERIIAVTSVRRAAD